MKRIDAHSKGWILAASIGCLLVVLAALPPFVGEELRHVVMAAFSGVCHQLPGRSPHIDGVQLAVCDRCFGIYAAIAAASLTFPYFRRWDGFINGHARLLVPISVVIPGIDWMGDLIGLWTNTPWSRFVTGAVFGWTAGYFLCRALVQLFGEKQSVDQLAHRTDPI